MGTTLIEEVASKLNFDNDVVDAVVEEFCKELNDRTFNYKGENNDYIGNQLKYDISPNSFFNLLGFLNCFNLKHCGGLSSEYLKKLGGIMKQMVSNVVDFTRLQ
jgi:hypothetical protein